MSHKTYWILVILMGTLFVGCSGEKRLVPPCPFDITDLIDAGSTETMLIENLAGNAAGEIWKKFREEMTPYQKCLYDRCNGKDEGCVQQESSDAQIAWLGQLNDTFIAIRPLDALILILIILVMIRHFGTWVVPKGKPWWFAWASVKAFLLFLVAYLLIIPVRWEVTGTIAFWIYFVALLAILVVPHFRHQAVEEEEGEGEDDDEEEDDDELIDNMETADSGGGDEFW